MGPGMGMQMRPEMKQQLVLAPRMIQSMEILQLPIMALQERIQEELEKNPVLEVRDTVNEGLNGEEVAAVREERNDATDPAKELVIDSKNGNEDDFDRLEKI